MRRGLVSVCTSRPIIHPFLSCPVSGKLSFASWVHKLTIYLVFLNSANRRHHQNIWDRRGRKRGGEGRVEIPPPLSLLDHDLAFSVFLFWRSQLLSGGLLFHPQLSHWGLVISLFPWLFMPKGAHLCAICELGVCTWSTHLLIVPSLNSPQSFH